MRHAKDLNAHGGSFLSAWRSCKRENLSAGGTWKQKAGKERRKEGE